MMRLGLTGWPVAHSLSPRLQNAALREAGVDGEYGLYPVDPAQPGALAELLGRLRSGELHGLNVTIPHKQAVMPLLDELSASARAIGAVNAIYMKDGRLVGHNTDAPGFLADLRNKFYATQDEWQAACSGQALVLGAGGSARAVVWALANAGWQVKVAARRVEQAEGLVESLRGGYGGRLERVLLDGSDEMRAAAAGSRLIVNSTSVGMTPKVDFSPWPQGMVFPSGAALYDLVYNPRETLLFRQARAAGLRAATGLGMLIEQAGLGFEIWTGRAAPRETMLAAVEA